MKKIMMNVKEFMKMNRITKDEKDEEDGKRMEF